MSGTLFVVATPIGNLEDVTLRALRVLGEVGVIAAEDTRRTARLLARHHLSTPTLSFHQHNARSRIPKLLSRLVAGDSVALVTDAGTPGISDPGVELVRACVDAGIPVDAVPGASAALTAAVLSGFALIPLTILGFPPRKAKDRRAWMDQLSRTEHTVTFFESPHRIGPTLREIADVLGERPIMVARELTKLHQEILRGSAISISERTTYGAGEFTVVVGPGAGSGDRSLDRSRPMPGALADEYIGLTTKIGRLTRRQALAATARKFRVTPAEVQAAVESRRRSGIGPNS